ncbi:type II toxin-antitoxin system RelE/ParE family toxin [Streptomyces sp. NPDC020965]|uniref:type II toxin-antitoxin system RelE/ParE family toxin n=1 Tax=Streptomyces sp. NPDC020965 TaxID=3365105 RepID=UPI003791FF85
MSRYRIRYSPEAEHGLAALSAAVRNKVTTEIAGRLGRDPYGHDSAPVRGDRNLRTVNIGRFVLIRYRIHGDQLLVTVVRAVAPW